MQCFTCADHFSGRKGEPFPQHPAVCQRLLGAVTTRKKAPHGEIFAELLTARVKLADPQPSCLHSTVASFRLHELLELTGLHSPSCSTSTRPAQRWPQFTNLTSLQPAVQFEESEYGQAVAIYKTMHLLRRLVNTAQLVPRRTSWRFLWMLMRTTSRWVKAVTLSKQRYLYIYIYQYKRTYR